MSWNGPVNGDWSVCDFSQPPFTNGVMTLSHDEVLFVIDALPPIEEQYLPDTNMVVTKYNELTSYEKAINGDTYNCIKSYDPAVNTLGIDSTGIIQPAPVEEAPTDTTPTDTTSTDTTTTTDGTTPTV